MAESLEEILAEDDNPRLSKGCDVVGFFDINDDSAMLELWQMHTPPSVGDTVAFEIGDALGIWKVMGRQWACYDGPFTVKVWCQKIS